MSTHKDFIEFLLDQINDEQARTRAMFGEYALYYNNIVVGLVCDNTLFIKVTDGTKRLLEEGAPTASAYPGAKPSFVVSETFIEDGEKLRELVQVCAEDIKKKSHTKG